MQHMQLYCTITAKNGQRVPLLLNDTTLTPTQLRQKVAETTKIPLKDLRLIFRGRMIKDDDSIPSVTVEYKLEDDSVLHCMGKPIEDDASNNSNNESSSASAPDTTTVPNRTVIPPLSTTTASASTTATASSSASASASATASASGSATTTTTLSKALLRLKQNNPLSVYATAVGTLEKVLTNITNNPMEDKYRRVKKSNAAFGKRLGKLVGGHDCMLATGFVVEHDPETSEEVYQLHAHAERWNALLQAKAGVARASSLAKQEQERAKQPQGNGGIGTNANSYNPTNPFGAAPSNNGAATAAAAAAMGGGMGGGNNPNWGNMMAQMMSNPEALGQALQNPMVREMMRNNPDISPMLRQQMETVANNPAMLQQMTQRMQDPAVQAQMRQHAMELQQNGGNGNNSTTASSAAPQPRPPVQNDRGQTEDEMIAEAIRRSLEDSN